MRHIRNGNYDMTVGLQKSFNGLQDRQRILEVLQHVGRNDHIVTIGAKLAFKVDVVEIANDDTFTDRGRGLCSLRMYLDTDDTTALLAECKRHMAATTA